MSRLYLLSSEVNSVETYYTADSSGAITSIGTTKDFTKGFDDAILALIPNSVYAGLTNGKVWMDSATDKTAATIASVNKGLIISGDEDDVCTAGYSGINSITTNASTNTMYALSFDQRNSWITRGNEQYIDKTNLLPKDATARKAIATIDSSYDKLFDQDNTTSVSFTTATTVIPIVFAKNTKLRKVFGRLITGSIQPVKFDVAVYSDTAKGYVSIGVHDEIAIKVKRRCQANLQRNRSLSAERIYNHEDFSIDNALVNSDRKFVTEIEYIG